MVDILVQLDVFQLSLAAKILGIRNYLVVASIPSKKSFKTFYDTILDLITLTSVEEVIINSKKSVKFI